METVIDQNNAGKETRTDRGVVVMNEFALHRIANSIVRVFFHDWSAFHFWKLDTTANVGWTLCVDYETRTVDLGEVVFESRDAARAFVLVTLLIAQHPAATSTGLQHHLRSTIAMATRLDREGIGRYLKEIDEGITNGDVSFEQGSMLWMFCTLDWILPAGAAEAPTDYDKLFEDSLMFSELKRLLERESA